MSFAFAPPGVALACVPGIAVCFEKDTPASVVRRTDPSRSSRYPVFLSTKYSDCTRSGQLTSATIKILSSVFPPSSLRRST